MDEGTGGRTVWGSRAGYAHTKVAKVEPSFRPAEMDEDQGGEVHIGYPVSPREMETLKEAAKTIRIQHGNAQEDVR